MKNKEALFSKNNYNIQLEELLDKKDFNDEAKSLILNILYKIDNGYKDYYKIKYGIKLKNEIIEDFIDIIKKKCDDIQIMDVKESKNKFFVNKCKKSIKVFPNEVNIMHALYYINTNQIIKTENIFEKIVKSILYKGYSVNEIEIIRDFDGWSWNNAIDNKNDRYYNLIYQNLLFLLGNQNMTEIVKSTDIITNLTNKIEEIYGKQKASELIEKLEICCILLYKESSKKNQKEIEEIYSNQKNILNKMQNKQKYISEITIDNNQNMQLIGRIESILKNETLLIKKFNKPEISKKYKNIENYKEYLLKIKNSKMEHIYENSKCINPFEYVKRKNNLEKEIKIFSNIEEISKKSDCIFKNFVELQRIVISCFHKKIEMYDLRKELINLVYEVRYYNWLPVTKDIKLKDISKLFVDRRNIQKKLINKLCENKIIDTFSKDYNINYTILKYIFETKNPNINKLYLQLNYEPKKLVIKYYDGNIIEREENINFSEDDINEINKKTNKKIKIFI